MNYVNLEVEQDKKTHTPESYSIICTDRLTAIVISFAKTKSYSSDLFKLHAIILILTNIF